MAKLVYNAPGLKQKTSGEKKENSQFFKKLAKVRPSELDGGFHILHDKYSVEISCLECANCCKSISPAVKDADIARLSRYLKIKPSELVTRYFDLDEEGDYVFRNQPCPFLGADNYCTVYESRPRACREYPHTDRAKMHQLLPITLQNIAVCPIVYEIVQDLKRDYS